MSAYKPDTYLVELAKAVAELIGKREGREEGWGMWYDLLSTVERPNNTHAEDVT